MSFPFVGFKKQIKEKYIYNPKKFGILSTKKGDIFKVWESSLEYGAHYKNKRLGILVATTIHFCFRSCYQVEDLKQRDLHVCFNVVCVSVNSHIYGREITYKCKLLYL